MTLQNRKLGSVCLALCLTCFASLLSAKGKHTYQEVYTSPGKPSAPININYDPISKPISVGDTVTINVNFQLNSSNKNLSVGIKPRHENLIALKQNSLHIKNMPMKNATESEPLPIQFTALQNGINYINVTATIETDSGKQFKSIAIPVIVGKPNWEEYLKPQGEIMEDASGQKVISLPATETIQ